MFNFVLVQEPVIHYKPGFPTAKNLEGSLDYLRSSFDLIHAEICIQKDLGSDFIENLPLS